MRKLKELKKNLMRHRPSNSSKDADGEEREERTNSKASSKVSDEERSDSARKNRANSELSGSQTGALEKLLGHLQSQGNLPDTHTLATAIAQYLQTLLGHNNSSKAGINMGTRLEPNEGDQEGTLTPKTSEQNAQASLQNLQTQLSTLSLAAQNEPELIGQTINIPLQFGGNVVSSIPLRLQLQQDPQTGIIQLVPISLVQPQTPHLQQGSKSLPATPRAGSTQQSQVPGQGEEAVSGRASAAAIPDLHTGSAVPSPHSQRGAQALIQKTAAMRSRNSQMPPNSGYWSDSGRHSRPKSFGGEVLGNRSNPDQSGAGVGPVPSGYSPQGDQGVASGMFPRGAVVGDHSSPRLQGSDRSPLADVAHRQNGRGPAGSASPSPSKDSGISGVNGSGQPTHASLMDRLLSSEALNRQRVLGQVLQMLRSEFNCDDGYMENGAEDLAVAEYIVSLTNLKWETFMSAVTEKYSEVYWSRDVLAGLYEVINGRPPSANSRILNTRTPPPGWSQADLERGTRDSFKRQRSDPATLDTPDPQSQPPPRVGQADAGSFSGTFPLHPGQARPKPAQDLPASHFSRHMQAPGVGAGEGVGAERVGAEASESSDSDCKEKKRRLKTRHELDRAKSSSAHNVSSVQPGLSLAAEPEPEPWEQTQPMSDRAIRYDAPHSDSRKYGSHAAAAAAQAARRKLDDNTLSPPISPRGYSRSESDGPYPKNLQASDSDLARRPGAYDGQPRATTVPRQASLKRSSEPLLLEQGSQSSREPDKSAKGDNSSAAETEHSQDSLGRGSTKLHYSLSIHHQKERCLGKPPSGYKKRSGSIQSGAGSDGGSPYSDKGRVGAVSGQDGALERREGIPEELPPFKSRCAIIHHWATMQHEMTTELETFMHEIDETNKSAIEARLRSIDQQLAMEKKMRKKTQKFYQKLKEPIGKSGKDDQKSVSVQVLKDLTEMTKKIRFLELCRNHLEMLIAELYGLETCFLYSLAMCGGRNQALQLQPYSDKHILQFQYLREHHGCEIQVLQAGEPDGLLAYLFTSSALSDGYIHQFLYCFRYFITSSHLFHFVHDRYLAALRGNQADMNVLRVQRRAVDLIHFWLEGFYIIDFEKDSELLKKLAQFVLKEIKTPSDNLSNLQVLVHTCLQGQQAPQDHDKDDKYFVHLDTSKKWGALTPMSRPKDGLGRPKSVVVMGSLKTGQDGEEESQTPRPTRRSDTFNILDSTPHALVEQLTLVKQELFQMTHPVHYLNSRAQGIDVSNTVPGLRTPSMPRRKPVVDNPSLFVGEQCFDSVLQRLISHAQEVSHWVTAEIVSCSSQKTQVAVLSHFLSAAQLCLEVNNFATGLAITEGLDHLIVRQLPAWKVLPSKYSAIMDVLVANKIKIKSSPFCLVKDRDCLFYPTIPSVFYFLVHIQQREHGSYRLANGMVKWTKMRQIAELCDQIRIFQEHEYIFEPDYEFQDALTQRIVEFSSQDLHTIAAQNDTNYRKISAGGIQGVLKKVKDKLQSK